MITAVLVYHKRPEKRPLRSANGESYDGLWAVANQCWDSSPQSRPPAIVLIDYLHPESNVLIRPKVRVRAGAFFFK